MEKRYLLVNLDEKDAKTETGNTDVVYYFDDPFKTKFYGELVSGGSLNGCRKEQFLIDFETYRILKENCQNGCDKITIFFNSGQSYCFEKNEISEVVNLYEKKIDTIGNILKIAKQNIEEGKNEPRIVVYTCITGGYDNILEPTYVTPGVDYICFTDDKTLKSKTWKFRPIPEELLSYSKVKQQRGVKILAHRYLSDYDISIWVDGAVIVKGNVKDYLKTLDFDKYSVFIPEHPARKCIYAEKDVCVRIKKITGDGIELANKQMQRYRDDKFPANYGLVQTNVMMRKHNDQYSKDLMEKWWSELKDFSHRDQLSFNYALWKVGSEKFKYLIKTTCNSSVFNWIKSHRKKQ